MPDSQEIMDDQYRKINNTHVIIEIYTFPLYIIFSQYSPYIVHLEITVKMWIKYSKCVKKAAFQFKLLFNIKFYE
jgi:hypothetical protein